MTREELYKLYLFELSLYSETVRSLSEDDILKQYAGVSSFNDLEWVDIYDGVERVGFILITTYEHCPAAYDYHIMETFILPKSRKKGLVKNTLLGFIKNHPGSYGLFILNRNVTAIGFWKRFLRNKEVEKIVPQSGLDIPSQCFELAFKTE